MWNMHLPLPRQTPRRSRPAPWISEHQAHKHGGQNGKQHQWDKTDLHVQQAPSAASSNTKNEPPRSSENSVMQQKKQGEYTGGCSKSYARTSLRKGLHSR